MCSPRSWHLLDGCFHHACILGQEHAIINVHSKRLESLSFPSSRIPADDVGFPKMGGEGGDHGAAGSRLSDSGEG